MPPPPVKGDDRHCVFHPSVRPLTPISCDAISHVHGEAISMKLSTDIRRVVDTAKRFSGSAVKG